jgi:hypothetical protein
MNYSLPKSVDINGEQYAIRYDFRVILEIIEMLNDADLENGERVSCLLKMFYCEYEKITDIKEAVKQCYKFIDMGDDRPKKKAPRLIDWEQDFEYIIAPVNRVLGYETRAVDYDPISNTGGVHWWTWLSGYMEMGSDTLMAQIITVRNKLAKGKKLEKYEREWLRNNRSIVEIKRKYSEKDNDLINEWTKGGSVSG